MTAPNVRTTRTLSIRITLKCLAFRASFLTGFDDPVFVPFVCVNVKTALLHHLSPCAWWIFRRFLRSTGQRPSYRFSFCVSREKKKTGSCASIICQSDDLDKASGKNTSRWKFFCSHVFISGSGLIWTFRR